jgi:methionyl-tRNA formyltransferase
VRLVFLGTPQAAVPSFHALIDAGHEVVLAVTQPDRPSGRSRQPKPPAIKRAAIERDVELFQPTKVRNTAFREKLSSRRPDLLVVVAYGRILPGSVLSLAPSGAINVHFSLLPSYRGAAPVQWALARGESISGVTTMQMNERMDEGDLLLQVELPIEEGEHAPALSRRLAEVGAELIVRTLSELQRGALRPVPQEHARATLAPLLRREDGEIGPELTAREIEGRVRGFDPWPGVWLRRSGRRLRLVEARAIERNREGDLPGTITELTDDGLEMVCGRGTCLLLTLVQPEGRRVMTVRDAANGRQLQPGDRLEAAAESD